MELEGHLDRLGCSSVSPSPALTNTGQETVSSSRRCPPKMVSQCAGGTQCSRPATTQGGVLLLCPPVPQLSAGRSAPRRAAGREGGCRLAGFLPLPGGPACNASRAGLRRSKKAAGCLGSALAEASAWQETLLILSQHSYGRAGRPQSRRDASCADTA